MKKILLVGFCYADAKQLRKFLESRRSSEIVETTRLEETKEILRQRKIDLIFVNRILVGDRKSGFEVMDYLKKSSARIPLIFLTRFLQVQQEALSRGAFASFDVDLLIGYIRPSMKQKQLDAISKLTSLAA